jgi:hypothetical protein
MNELELIASNEIRGLADEVVRYLSAVDVFRDEGCAPEWQAEDARSPMELAAAA